ncbi:unnamed protein product, partial [Laminaria digitata]
EKISAFDAEDFVFQLGGPEADALVGGIQLRRATLGQIPALEGQGIAMAMIHLGPCAIFPPHFHPRATEMVYTIEGSYVRVAFVEENGGDGAVVNDLSQGDVSFVPQGLVHYQQNLGCEPATFLVALNSEDPGAVILVSLFFDLPSEALLNVDEAALSALQQQLSEAPALARLECLERCGLE